MREIERQLQHVPEGSYITPPPPPPPPFSQVREIERQLQHASPANVAKQVLVSTGPLQLVMLIKAWALGIATVLRSDCQRHTH